MKPNLACLLCAFILAWSSSLAAQSPVYSWVDAKGARNYSDKPPAGLGLSPIKIKVSEPSKTQSSVVAAQGQPASMPATQVANSEQVKRQRAEDCEVARNNVRLLDDPKTQVIEKGSEGSSSPLDNTARIEARALAERQVQDFCRG